jgi:hypothetical protein
VHNSIDTEVLGQIKHLQEDLESLNTNEIQINTYRLKPENLDLSQLEKMNSYLQGVFQFTLPYIMTSQTLHECLETLLIYQSLKFNKRLGLISVILLSSY